MKTALSLASVAALSLVAPVAQAQGPVAEGSADVDASVGVDAQLTVPTPTVRARAVVPPPPVVVVATPPAPPPPATVAAPPPPAAAPAAPGPSDGPRLRFGFGLAGGTFVPTNWTRIDRFGGAMGGLTGQIGIQFNRFLGLTYNAFGMGGYFERGFQGTTTGEGVAVFYNSALLDLTLGNLVQFGAGPALHFFAGCSANLGAVTATCSDTGPHFGMNGRVALVLGGFTVAADIHPTFYTNADPLIGMTLSVGGVTF